MVRSIPVNVKRRDITFHMNNVWILSTPTEKRAKPVYSNASDHTPPTIRKLTAVDGEKYTGERQEEGHNVPHDIWIRVRPLKEQNQSTAMPRTIRLQLIRKLTAVDDVNTQRFLAFKLG
ncbi:hypothetical protein J6590_053934 [Homalodisca vitripennis]|nr:hypothetical protein J6590_053934 [Homalodisca vitripennis]